MTQTKRISTKKEQLWHAKHAVIGAWNHLDTLTRCRQRGLFGRLLWISHVVYMILFAGCVACGYAGLEVAAVMLGICAGLFTLVELLRAHNFYGLVQSRQELWKLVDEYRTHDLLEREGFIEHKDDVMRRSADAISKAYALCRDLSQRDGFSSNMRESMGLCAHKLRQEHMNMYRVRAMIWPQYVTKNPTEQECVDG